MRRLLCLIAMLSAGAAAWPAGAGAARAPHPPLARWLADQIGPVAVHKRRGPRPRATLAVLARAAAAQPSETPATDVRFGQAPGKALDLVRSFDIPASDPAAARLANLSWTYDNALAVLAFTGLGDGAHARQLLDQLDALQAKDGSLAFAYDVRSGAGSGAVRSNALAWVGIAAVAYRRQTGSNRYDHLIAGLADYLLKSRRTDGLVLGGPDVQWVSTQHNLLMAEFFRSASVSFGERPIGRGVTGPELRAAYDKVSAAILDNLLKRAPFNDYHGLGWFFVQGLDDPDMPLDVQTLGSMFMWLRERTFENPWAFVTYWTTVSLYVAPRDVDGRSSERLPAVRGAERARHRLERGHGAGGVDAAPPGWPQAVAQADAAVLAITRTTRGGTAGPAGADRASFTRRWGEFPSWPTSAVASWLLIEADAPDVLFAP